MEAKDKRAGFLPLTLYFFLACIASGWFTATAALLWIPAPAFKPAGRTGLTLVVAVGLAAALVALGLRLKKELGRSFFYFQLGLLATAAALLGFAETWSRSSLAPWPARDLHGRASGAPAEELHSLHPIAVDVNSWGQRDEERSPIPDANRLRTAVLGGGFLEDSSKVPLSMLLEERADGEFVNLGVRGSNPRDLYWRAKKVALPLGARRLIVFFDPAEDFLTPQDSDTKLLPHLASLVVDRPPKTSLLGELFPALIRRLLPMPLVEADAEFAAQVSTGKAEDLAETLARLAPANKRAELAARLNKRNLKPLASWLARPDFGFVQASFVKRLLVSALGEQLPPLSKESRETTAKWIRATLRLALREGADTTLVLVPPAELVDERIREIWAPIGDVRRQASRYGDGLDFMKETFSGQSGVLDLRAVLRGTRGTYLDADGHWSRTGTELVVAKLAEFFSKPGASPGAL